MLDASIDDSTDETDEPVTADAARDRPLRQLDAARRALADTLARASLQNAWYAFAQRALSKELDVMTIRAFPRRDGDDANTRRRELDLCARIVTLLERARQPIDATFGEPLPERFVFRRMRSLIDQIAPDRRTVELVLAAHPGAPDATDARAIELALEAIEETESTLVTVHTPLAAQAIRRIPGAGIEEADRMQEARVALLRAIRGFRHEMGTRFSTYAVNWLSAMLHRARMNTAETVRVPVHMQAKLSAVRRAQKKLQAKSSTKPSARAIAKEVDLPLATVEKLLALDDRSWVSLDAGAEGGSAPVIVATPPSSAPDRAAFIGERSEQIQAALATLKPRERAVLERRFGFSTAGREETLEEIGRSMNLTRERIRQIEKAALERLQSKLCELDED